MNRATNFSRARTKPIKRRGRKCGRPWSVNDAIIKLRVSLQFAGGTPTHESLQITGHRPWPLQSGPWVMRQIWYDLLFAHWRIPARCIERFLPPQLEIDTFDGSAWLGVVPFGMRGVRMRALPAIPGTSTFLELNVRTYVRMRGDQHNKSGVWFFSLDAANRLAVAAARRCFYLPYYFARMHHTNREGAIHYHSTRDERTGEKLQFEADYEAAGDVYNSTPGSIDHFLTERYCLYCSDDRGGIFRGEIHHRPWPLQPARAKIIKNEMSRPLGVSLPSVPDLLHFARELDVLIWPLQNVLLN